MPRYSYDTDGTFAAQPPGVRVRGQPAVRARSSNTLDGWTPQLAAAPSAPMPMWVSSDGCKSSCGMIS